MVRVAGDSVAADLSVYLSSSGLGVLVFLKYQSRGSFAYPDFARDIIEKGEMIPNKCCVTCGVCTKIMRQPTGRPGCPVRDTAWYQPEYQRVLGGKK